MKNKVMGGCYVSYPLIPLFSVSMKRKKKNPIECIYSRPSDNRYF